MIWLALLGAGAADAQIFRSIAWTEERASFPFSRASSGEAFSIVGASLGSAGLDNASLARFEISESVDCILTASLNNDVSGW